MKVIKNVGRFIALFAAIWGISYVYAHRSGPDDDDEESELDVYTYENKKNNDYSRQSRETFEEEEDADDIDDALPSMHWRERLKLLL
jgi:hypothetical protein